jgi:hypothetical protein
MMTWGPRALVAMWVTSAVLPWAIGRLAPAQGEPIAESQPAGAPVWQRVLTVEDERRAKDLAQQLRTLREQGKYAEAIPLPVEAATVSRSQQGRRAIRPRWRGDCGPATRSLQRTAGAAGEFSQFGERGRDEASGANVQGGQHEHAAAEPSLAYGVCNRAGGASNHACVGRRLSKRAVSAVTVGHAAMDASAGGRRPTSRRGTREAHLGPSRTGQIRRSDLARG